MNEKKKQCIWVIVPAIYAIILGVLIIVGLPFSLITGEDYYGNAVKMPIIAALIAILTGVSGIGLIKNKSWGRHIFLLIAPWASIALGSVFASALWQEDVPYTLLLILVYALSAFMLSRSSSLRTLGYVTTSWRNRGGAFIGVATLVMFITRLIVSALKPTSRGAFGTLDALNRYVQYLVLCDVPLWNYVIGLIVISIPLRRKTIPTS